MKVYIIISIFKYIWIILNNFEYRLTPCEVVLHQFMSNMSVSRKDSVYSFHLLKYDSTRPVSWCLMSSNKLINPRKVEVLGWKPATPRKTTACLKNDAGDPCHHQSLYTIPTLADGMETYGNSERDRDGKLPISSHVQNPAEGRTESQIQMLLSRHISNNPPAIEALYGTLYHL